MIRTGIDRGFDRGAAAWTLDLTGCVATADTEAAAVERLPARVEAFVAWLAGSGESVSVAREAMVTVVERLDSHVLNDGHEINATFADDHRPVTSPEADTALRWLDRARERLERAIATTAGTESLAGEGRSRDDLIAHVVRAERWLATRVEPDQGGIAFPPEDVPLDRQLSSNRDFVGDHVRRAADGDGVHARVDSRGEEWTTRKVLRRLVYHVLDHAEELERRGGRVGRENQG